jgi:hypothetical protein
MDESVGAAFIAISAIAGLCTFGLIHALVRVRWLQGVPSSVRTACVGACRVDGKELLALLLLGCACVAMSMPWLTRGLEYDELFTASRFVVDVSLWTAASSVRAFNNHVAYSLLANLGVHLLGPAEWVIRLPALLLGLATVFMLWQVARKWCTAATAMLSAAILVLSPFFEEWARSARGYSGLMLMTLASSYYFFLALEDGSPRTGVLHVVATALAVYFHLYGVWVAIVQYAVFCVAAFARRQRQPIDGGPDTRLAGLRVVWHSFIALPLIVLVLYLPLALPLAAHVVRRGIGVGPLPAEDNLAIHLLEAYSGIGTPFLAVAACLLAVPGIACLRKRGMLAAYLVGLIAIPFLTMSLLIRPFDLYTRFFAYWTPIFAFLFANGITGTWRWARGQSGPRMRAMGLTLSTALSLATIALAASWLRTDLRPVPQGGYREALGALRDSPVPVVTAGGDSDMFDYYLGGPHRVIYSLADLERFTASAPDVVVAYHNMDWNDEEARSIAAVLGARCDTDERGVVILFHCSR